MDKVIHYRKLLKQIFREQEDLEKRAANSDSQSQVEAVFSIDEEHDTYSLLQFGWTKNGRVKALTAFARLRDGKIYIEEDWTQEGIADELMRRGVPSGDIVIAFHPPEMRQYTEFAAA
jgi:hypothetical protein